MAEGGIPRGAHLVCIKCLQDNPRDFSLIQYRCLNLEEHHGARNVHVWKWHNEGILEMYPPGRDVRPPIRDTPRFFRFPGKFTMCYGPNTNKCKGKECNHAHSIQEMERWNAMKFLQGRSQSDTVQRDVHQQRSQSAQRPHQSHYEQAPGPTRQEPSGIPRKRSPVPSYRHRARARTEKKFSAEEMAVLSYALSQSNYKEKLTLLLHLEEMAHEEELQERCDGEYRLHIDSTSASTYSRRKFNGASHYQHDSVYLSGLNGDQISYATQASRKVSITYRDKILGEHRTIQADIDPRNYSHTEDKLYLDFDDSHFAPLSKRIKLSTHGLQVTVKFLLKFQYFDRLRDSVRRVPQNVVSRIVPDGFSCTPRSSQCQPLNPDQYRDLSLNLCSSDQLEALKVITSCSKGEPPIVITGPFGSGKTRLLALASHISFRSFQAPVHLLVCVQQHVSADAFLTCFNDLSTASDVYIVQVVTESKYHHSDSTCRTVSQLEQMVSSGFLEKKKKVMVISTCSTANNLLYKQVFDRGYFSHIYIDEGAQMREPEAVAPLGFATKETILVMAGDQHQVGPAMLVLGEKPQECGLAVSLVERLHKAYTEEKPEVGAKCHRPLTTNFRCHPDIMKLSGDLFYHAPLTSKIKPHEDAPFPFHFVCSDVDDKLRPIESDTFYSDEAEVVAELMVKFSIAGKVFPLDGNKPETSRFAYASPCRSQLSTIEKLVKKHKKLSQVKKVPIYDIQGNEYQALFLSTTEPTYKDGSTRNPTKSICDPFVFNTVISRARSVIVSVGNPFTLLRKETHMVKKYGNRAKCWSNYLKLCILHKTIHAAPLLELSEEEWQWRFDAIRGCVYKMVPDTGHNLAAALPSVSQNDYPDLEEGSSNSSDEAKVEDSKIRLRRTSTTLENEAKFTRDYRMLGRLGKGGYGVVYRVKNKFDEGDYAVKIIKLNPRSKHDIKREVKALAKLNHPRIVRYYTSWTETLPEGWQKHELWADLKDSETYTQREDKGDAAPAVHMATLKEQSSPSSDDSFVIQFGDDDTTRKPVTESDINRISVAESEPRRKPSAEPDQPTCLFIQTELCKRETLRDWLTNHTDKRPRKKVLKFIKQALEAVGYIHQKELMHRDLKPSNILFAQDETDSLKVGDFGLVTQWEQSTEKTATSSKSPSAPRRGGRVGSHTVNAGTELYRSPEQRAKKKYNSKVDIFALGLIFFELNYPMITGHQMNKVFGDLREKGGEGFPHDFIQNLPHEARLIGAMVDPDPGKRPTVQEILDSEDLQKIEEDINTGRMEYVPFSEM